MATRFVVQVHMAVWQPGNPECSFKESIDIQNKVPTQIHRHPNLIVQSINFSKFQCQRVLADKVIYLFSVVMRLPVFSATVHYDVPEQLQVLEVTPGGIGFYIN